MVNRLNVMGRASRVMIDWRHAIMTVSSPRLFGVFVLLVVPDLLSTYFCCCCRRFNNASVPE